MPTDSPELLDDIIITTALAERPAPPRDLAVEHAAMADLSREAAINPSGLIQRLVDLATELCDAGTAGLSLLEPAAPRHGVFRWVALSGAYREYVGGTTPEAFSPCGVCLARGSAQLYAYPARVFTYLAGATPPIVEGLVIPLRSFLGPLGTIWIVSHTEDRQFTSTDVAVMTTLGDFTSAALALERARGQAEAASRAKDEFLAVVSHELRTPLTGLLGWSELLLAGRATPAVAARAIVAIHASAQRQQSMVEDLLDASRAITGKLQLDESVLDLSAVVHSALEMMAAHAQARSLEILTELDGPVPFRGDAPRLLQVISNLLGNAIKFTPDGGRITLRLRVAAAGPEISVRDNGIGIDAHVLPEVFDAFRQADTTSTRRNQGLGLGLTIARRLVELHGGTIEAQSDGRGRGAVFTARLPATRLSIDPCTMSGCMSRADQRVAGLTVLVLEDDTDVRDMVAAMLEGAGAIVVTAASVASARSCLSDQSVDVLLADIGMPDEDGCSLAAQLRRRELPRPRASIAVTGYAGEQDRRRALAAGFDGYVTKPIDFGALFDLIAAVMPTTRGR